MATEYKIENRVLYIYLDGDLDHHLAKKVKLELMPEEQEGFGADLIILTTNIVNGSRILEELKSTEPMKLPPVGQASINPF